MSERRYSDYAARVQVDKVEQENTDLKAENAALRAEVERLRQPKRRGGRKPKVSMVDIAKGEALFNEKFAKLSPKDQSSVNAFLKLVKTILDGRRAMFCLVAGFDEDDQGVAGMEVYDVNAGTSPMIYEFAGRLQSLAIRVTDHADEEREKESENTPQPGCNCPKCRALRGGSGGRSVSPKDMN